jgi:hypothetical protein
MSNILRFAFVVLILIMCSLPSFADDDDDDAPKGPTDGLPTLNPEQQRAAGVVTAHPVNASVPLRIDALGVILDPSEFIEDNGNVESYDAAAHAASAEVDRLQGLFKAGAGASLKTLQAAQSDEAHARTQAQAAHAKMAARWRPLASMQNDARQKLIATLASGRSLLARADVPGRHILGDPPQKALLIVDGVEVEAQVLGVLARGAADTQGVSVLLDASNPPTGLGIGARMPVQLLGVARSGVSIARDALLYDKDGAYVYQQLKQKPGDDKVRYGIERVQLIAAYGDGWLVTGIDDDDNIVVHGAGVLWSLQGLAGKSADDDDDD